MTDGLALTRWGWHNRDYTQMDPFASVKPNVDPGEGVIGTVVYPGGATIEVWHFQDDAISGDVFIDDQDLASIFVDQYMDQYPLNDGYMAVWRDEHYRYIWPLCPGTGVDGPDEIVEFSKDLAFELWTEEPPPCYDRLPLAEQIVWDIYIAAGRTAAEMECWCYRWQCRGDGANDIFQPLTLKWVVYSTDLNVLLGNWRGTPGLVNPCADYAHDIFQPATLQWCVYSTDLNVLLTNWRGTPTTLTDCPGYIP